QPNASQKLGSVFEVRRQIRSAHLQIDRGGSAEIQDLTDDIAWQEREGYARKARRQLLAQRLHVLGRRPVAGLQRDLDVAVLRADGAGVVIGQGDSAYRHTDVVG